MKIAIPCENGEVMQHFGHATEFTVYTIEDIKPIEKETVTFDDTDHEKVAGGLKSRGVDLVICGNIGEGAHAAIDNAHMLLIFLLPLAAAALHLAFAQPMVWQIMQLFGIQNLTLFLGVTGAALLLFALLYCAMYRLTSNAYFRIVSTGGAAA